MSKLYLFYLRNRVIFGIIVLATVLLSLIIAQATSMLMLSRVEQKTEEQLRGISCSLLIPQDERTKDSIEECLNINRVEPIEFEPLQSLIAPTDRYLIKEKEKPAVDQSLKLDTTPVVEPTEDEPLEELPDQAPETEIKPITRIADDGVEEFQYPGDKSWQRVYLAEAAE